VQIEAVLAEHPAVTDCQVVGVGDGDAAKPYAFVTLAPDAAFDERVLIEYARARMARYKVPARVIAVESFPTVESANAIKVQKARLREMAQALDATAMPAG
jgi:fatty-acyl-CoA synthase